MTREHRPFPRAGLTLIEIMTTIAIIATLVGIAIPALSSARQSGQSIVCSSNIRQLQIANDLYATDHDGRYLPGAVEFRTKNLHRWHGARDGAGEPFDASRGPITPYLNSTAESRIIRVCPTFAPTLERLEDTGAGFERAGGGYGYNNAFVGVVRRQIEQDVWVVETTKMGALRTRFSQPAATIAFTDAAFASQAGVEGLIEYSFAEPRVWPDFPGARPNPSIHFRHGGGANVAWLDGHVSGEHRTFSWAGFGYGVDSSSAGLGWFGERDDNSLFGAR